MSEMEKEEFMDRIKSMGEEEKQMVIKLLPSELLWEELLRRDQIKTKMLSDIKTTLKMEGKDEN